MNAAVRKIDPTAQRAQEVLAGNIAAGAQGVVDLQAERFVIGVTLNRGLSDAVREVLPSGAAFYSGLHARTWDAALAVHDQHGRVDMPAVVAMLRDQQRTGDAEAVARGLRDELRDLMVDVPVPTERVLVGHATSIRNRWTQRRAAALAIEIEAMAYDRTRTADDVMLRALSGFHALQDESAVDSQDDYAKSLKATFAAAIKARQAPILSTGQPSLDRWMLGLQPKQVTLIGARTSVGKSCLATQIAVAVARQRRGVYYASLEMSRETLAERAIAHIGRINSRWKWMAAEKLLPAEQHFRLMPSINAFLDLPWFTRAKQSATMAEIYLEAKRQAVKFAAAGTPLGLVVVDHVGLVRPPSELVGRSRVEQVGATSRALRAIADDLGCHVIGVAQINRAAADKPDAVPQLHHLRDTGDLEQDADTVVLVHRKRDASGVFVAGDPASIILAKNRVQGELGSYLAAADMPHQTFSEIMS